jgi:CrcB protein
MSRFLLVGAGGALGAAARYGVSLLAARWPGFPFATLAVNVAGCLAIGLLSPVLTSESARLFLITGVLGGFTTFSAFGADTQALAAGGRPGLAAVYVGLSVGAGLGAVWLGRVLAR